MGMTNIIITKMFIINNSRCSGNVVMMEASTATNTGSSAPVEIEIQLGGSRTARRRKNNSEKDEKPKSALVKDDKPKKEATMIDFGWCLPNAAYLTLTSHFIAIVSTVLSKIDEAVRNSIPLESMK